MENTAAPGFREHPTRPGLGRVERDNPVGVRTLVRSADREGGPTPRRAQDGSRSQCRCAERRRETGTARPHPPRSSRITGRIQAVAWPERELTWTG